MKITEVTGPIEGVNLDKIKLALQLLKESGIPSSTMASIIGDLQTERCATCKRHWPIRARGVHPVPSWRYSRSRISRHTAMEDRIQLPFGWYPDVALLSKYKTNGGIGQQACWDSGGEWTSLSRACEPCLVERAPRLGKEVAQLPKKQLVAFLRLYKWSLPHLLKRYQGQGDYATKFYITFTNGIMQELPPEDNKKTWLMLVDCAHILKLL